MGVFATRSFEEGELIFTVARDSVLLPVAPSEVPGPVSQEGRLAFALARERSRGESSEFWPYVEVLPDSEALSGHPALWDSEVEVGSYFGGSHRASRLIAGVRGGFAEDIASMVDAGLAFEDAAWALAVVTSREFASEAAPVGPGATPGEPRQHLVPLLDSMNTAVTEDACIDVDGARSAPWTVRCAFTVDGDAHIYASRAVQAEEELFVSYGPLSSAELLAGYGFLPSASNLFEGVDLPIDLTTELQLLECAAEDAEDLRRSLSRVLCKRFGWDGASPFLLELRAGVDGDGDPGGRLLPLARLFSLKSAEELASVEPRLLWMCRGGLGRPQNLGLELEMRARRRVERWVAAVLHKADAAAEELLADASRSLRLRSLAKQLLQSERELLQLEQSIALWFDTAAKEALAEGLESDFIQEVWSDDKGWYEAG